MLLLLPPPLTIRPVCGCGMHYDLQLPHAIIMEGRASKVGVEASYCFCVDKRRCKLW